MKNPVKKVSHTWLYIVVEKLLSGDKAETAVYVPRARWPNPTKGIFIFIFVILDDLKRNMSRGNSLSDELELSSVLGDSRAYLYSPVWG